LLRIEDNGVYITDEVKQESRKNDAPALSDESDAAGERPSLPARVFIKLGECVVMTLSDGAGHIQDGQRTAIPGEETNALLNPDIRVT
jgi:hypothetical protein